MVSRALSRRFCSGHASPVRILWRRSQSLMIMTRTSRLMASSILRRFSACSSSMFENWILVSLVTPSTSSGHLLAESGGQVGQCGGGVLHHVVQQGGGDALGVHAEVQHEAGHGQRVADIRLTAAAADALVGVVGHIVGFFDHGHVVGLAAGLDGLHQLVPRHDLGPHLRGQRPLGGVGWQGRGGHGRHLRHRHGLVEMGLCRIAVLSRRSRCCGRRGGDWFLSLRHLYRSSRHFRMGASARFFLPVAGTSSQNLAPPRSAAVMRPTCSSAATATSVLPVFSSPSFANRGCRSSACQRRACSSR